MSRYSTRVALAAAAAAFSAGCGDAATSTQPAVTLEIVGDSLLTAGEARSFRAIARSASGRELPGGAVTWAVLDPVVAGVDGAGRVTGNGPGATGVIARMGSLADTARIRVQWGALQRGEIRGQVDGASGGATYFRWTGLAKVSDVLATTDGDRSTVHGSRTEVAHRDSSLTIALPSVLSAGAHAIRPYPLAGARDSAPSALLAVGEAGVDLRVYYGVGGTLTIEDAAFPDRPGLVPGNVRGRFSFRATRYLVGADGYPVETGDTVTVSGEMLLDLQHLLRPSATVTLDGGPVAGASVSTVGQSSREPTGFMVWWEADMDGVLPHPFPWEVSHAFVLRTPGEGTFPLGDMDPATLADPDAWPPAWSELHYRDHAEYGLSDSGTVTITRWVAPTDEAYGEIHGTLDTTLELWDGEASTGRRVRTRATFAIPVAPLGGVPN